MKTSLYSIPAAILLALAPPAFAQTDSTGASTGGISNYGDVIASSTWNRISGKPATATRWPTWNEVTNKPSTFPPASHNHDSRYVRQGASGSISGNLSVSGTVTGNRVVTGDVGGDRWCRATTSGRIQCTYSSPAGTGCGSDRDMTIKASSSSCFGADWTGSILTITQCRSGSWRTVTTFNGCTPRNRSCFVAGTKVLMADRSLKNIEDVKVGERLINAYGGVDVVRFHDRVFMRPGSGQKLVSINGDDFFMSNNHPVLTADGWKAVDPESGQNEALDQLEGRVGQLAVGDVILGADGKPVMTVESIVIREDEEPVKLYNFVLSGSHTFVANGFAVHAFEPDRQGRMPIINEHPDADDLSLRPGNAPEGMLCVDGYRKDRYNPQGGIACWWIPEEIEVLQAA